MTGTRVEGPPGHPLFGHLWQFHRDRLGFLAACHRRHGETTRLRIVSPVLLVNNPADVHRVLVEKDDHYRKSWRITGRAGRRLFARALLTKEGAQHRTQRTLVQTVFHRRAVAVFTDAIHEHVERMLATWEDGAVVDVTAEMDELAERVLIRTLFGELDEAAVGRLSAANRARRRFIDDAFSTQFPFPLLLPTRRNREYRRASRRLAAMMRALVQRAFAGEVDPDSLLAQMASPANAASERLGQDELVEEISELLTAGYETTREALTWSTFLMAKHAEAAARVRAEASEQRAFGAEGTGNMHYTEMFFSEALRLYPPAWMFVRVAAEDDVLPSGVHVAAGSKIFLCPYTAHRNEAIFPDPERFLPERFERAERRARPRLSYFPFGGGRRVCVAESLARLEGVVTLASVARRFELTLCPDQVIEPIGRITLRPKTPILVRVRRVPDRSSDRRPLTERTA